MTIGVHSTATWHSRLGILSMAAGFAITFAATAHAQQPPTFRCKEVIIPPGPDPDLPKIAPNFRSTTDLSENEFDCLAWQDLIYLMWPAQANQRGIPDTYRKLGASGPTVWESYRTADTVFLPEGRDPGPWQQLQLMTTLQPSLAQQVANGAVRNLTMTAKVSRPVLSTILQNAAAFPPAILKGISQAGGGTLYDLNGFPVYYEVAMDKPQYDYIRDHQLYNAYRQAVYARTNVISLPAGTKDNPLGAVEVKAAWKVLTDAERHSGRFHTIQALLGGSKNTVTVGLRRLPRLRHQRRAGRLGDIRPDRQRAVGKAGDQREVQLLQSELQNTRHRQTMPVQCEGCQSGTSCADNAQRRRRHQAQHLHALHSAEV